MNRQDILEQLVHIFRKELDNKKIVLTETTTASDIDEWDSLSHIQLIVAIEKAFKVRFNSAEIQSWQNLGKMIDSLEGKLS